MYSNYSVDLYESINDVTRKMCLKPNYGLASTNMKSIHMHKVVSKCSETVELYR